MEEKIELELKADWHYTSELWINCSQCDFVFLVPVVLMVGKKPKNLKTKEVKGSLLGMTSEMFQSPKYPFSWLWKFFQKGDDRSAFGFLWPYSKFCNKCKAVHVARSYQESMKLEDKYWERLDPEGAAGFLSYLEGQTRSSNLREMESCECGGTLQTIDHCPLCRSAMMMSEKEIDGLPIMIAGV